MINRIPLRILQGKTSYEVLFGAKPEYGNMKIFGCLCFMTDILPGKSKFDPRARPCVFLGYPFNQKGYKVFDLTNHSVHISRDVVFKETVFPYHESSYTSPLDRNHKENISLPMVDNLEIHHDDDFEYLRHTQSDLVDERSVPDTRCVQNDTPNRQNFTNNGTSCETVSPHPRKSTRVPKQPAKLQDYICGNITSNKFYILLLISLTMQVVPNLFNIILIKFHQKWSLHVIVKQVQIQIGFKLWRTR